MSPPRTNRNIPHMEIKRIQMAKCAIRNWSRSIKGNIVKAPGVMSVRSS